MQHSSPGSWLCNERSSSSSSSPSSLEMFHTNVGILFNFYLSFSERSASAANPKAAAVSLQPEMVAVVKGKVNCLVKVALVDSFA